MASYYMCVPITPAVPCRIPLIKRVFVMALFLFLLFQFTSVLPHLVPRTPSYPVVISEEVKGYALIVWKIAVMFTEYCHLSLSTSSRLCEGCLLVSGFTRAMQGLERGHPALAWPRV
ncbi:hypothetical protein BDV27DRAFT_34080 [Aspergillus caelatus]|uniref:Uncharacterized protein n=1 Tax=Aspergillus caelatus TaxID=61420 RepID=A0A5N6ZU55_9EURO|nr:uncharacterized protein BDV27DRAFT_34080 [Aspergillus caelatus]KAE8360928.1 hypothetical protein BDV27DRAFT_34080 [Aspergillus caelatus]